MDSRPSWSESNLWKSEVRNSTATGDSSKASCALVAAECASSGKRAYCSLRTKLPREGRAEGEKAEDARAAAAEDADALALEVGAAAAAD